MSRARAATALVVGRAIVPGRSGKLRLTGPLALEVEGGRIVSVGEACDGLGCERAALGHADAVLLPGLSDSHLHLLAAAADRAGLDFASGHPGSIAELRARLAAADAALGRETWLRATGFDERYVAERRPPTRAELDAAVACRPVRVRHVTRHASLLNSEAVARLERRLGPLGASNLPPDSAGMPGAVVYHLEPELSAIVGPVADAALDEGLAEVSNALARCGVTCVDEVTATNDRARVARLAAAVRAGCIRQRLRVWLGDADEIEEARRAAGGWLEVVGVKLFARTVEEARSPGFAAALVRARRAGVPVAVHAVEADAVGAALDALEGAPCRASAPEGTRGAPHRALDRLEHCALCPPELARRIAQAGVAVVTQPGFLIARGDKYRAEVEEPLWRWLYPLRMLRGAGVPVVAGSDAPVGPLDPRVGLVGATTRRTETGAALGPAERLDDMAALELYTCAAARTRGEVPAWLTPGAPADLALLERNPVREGWQALRATAVLVGGRQHLVADPASAAPAAARPSRAALNAARQAQ